MDTDLQTNVEQPWEKRVVSSNPNDCGPVAEDEHNPLGLKTARTLTSSDSSNRSRQRQLALICAAKEECAN